MEVIYRKTIVEKMQEAIAAAARKNKAIEVINLTPAEWRELRFSLNGSVTFRPSLFGPTAREPEVPTMFMGVNIKVIEEPCDAGFRY
jgi:hypothetical protein